MNELTIVDENGVRAVPPISPRDEGIGWRLFRYRNGTCDFVRLDNEGGDLLRIGLKDLPTYDQVNILFEISEVTNTIIPMDDLCFRLKITELQLYKFIQKLQKILSRDWYIVFFDGLGVVLFDKR